MVGKMFVLLGIAFLGYFCLGPKKDENEELYESAVSLYLLGDTQNRKLAADKFEQAAKNGHLKAAGMLGTMYMLGKGIEQNYEAGVKWLLPASEGTQSDFIQNLAVCYQNGLGVEVDLDKSFSLSSKAADLGNVRAMGAVAHCYLHGLGVEQDQQKALDLFKSAAKQNDPFSQTRLAMLYHIGVGGEKNIEEAIYWYQTAVFAGDMGVMELLEAAQEELASGEDSLGQTREIIQESISANLHGA